VKSVRIDDTDVPVALVILETTCVVTLPPGGLNSDRYGFRRCV
jgi:hypothetical protein